jgi:hypothetical protein
LNPQNPYWDSIFDFTLITAPRYRGKYSNLPGGALSVLVRVKPVNRQDPAYFTQQIAVPDQSAEAKGVRMFAGGFDLGHGRYEVDWTMHDRAGRACSFRCELEAKLGFRERTITLSDNAIAEGVASPFRREALIKPRGRAKASREDPPEPFTGSGKGKPVGPAIRQRADIDVAKHRPRT